MISPCCWPPCVAFYVLTGRKLLFLSWPLEQARGRISPLIEPEVPSRPFHVHDDSLRARSCSFRFRLSRKHVEGLGDPKQNQTAKDTFCVSINFDPPILVPLGHLLTCCPPLALSSSVTSSAFYHLTNTLESGSLHSAFGSVCPRIFLERLNHVDNLNPFYKMWKCFQTVGMNVITKAWEHSSFNDLTDWSTWGEIVKT